MPEPKKGEKKQDYINRCTSELIESEGYKPDQARAICESKWNDRNKKKSVNIELFQDKIWAIYPSKLEEINAFIMQRFNSGTSLDDTEIEALVGRSGNKGTDNILVQDGVAKIPIMGTIAKKANLMSRMSGGTSTDLLKRDIKSAFVDDDVKAVLLQIDSPGGTVEGVKELADFVFSNKNKPVVAHTDGMMASAAYWIGSAADKVFATDTSMVGSIGVASVHYDLSEQDKMRGIKRTNIYAGKYKRIAADNEPLSKEGKEYIQEHIDDYYGMFLDSVAQNRGVSKEKAVSMAEGKVFIGKKALDIGLIDSIGQEEDAVNWALSLVPEGGKETAIIQETEVPVETESLNSEGGIEAMDKKELKEKYPELYAQIQQETKGEAEATFKSEVKAITEGMKSLQAENRVLSKKLELMEEKGIQAKVETLWTEKLSKSKIPTRRHDSVKRQISVDSFDKEGVIDWGAFSAAIDTEITDWEKDFQTSTNVLGFSTSSKDVESGDVDLNDDEREVTAEEQALIDRNLKLAGAVK